MGFLTDETRLRSHVKLSENLELSAIIQKKQSIIYKELAPLFGMPFLNAVELFEASTTPAELDMFLLIEQAIACGCVLKSIPEQEVHINEAGIIRHEDPQGSKSAYASQIDRLNKQLTDNMYDAIDSAILSGYVNGFTGFDTTPVYLLNQNLPFKTAMEFNTKFRMQRPSLTYWNMMPIIKECMLRFATERYSQPVIDAIINPSTQNAVTDHALNLLQYAIANATMYESYMKGLISKSPDGIRFIGGQQESSYTEELQPNIQLASAQVEKYKNDRDMYLEKLSAWVYQQYSTFGLQQSQLPQPYTPENFFL